MTARELNQKLITAFPELERAYHEQTDWQEGDDTGSHVVYGDVLVPVISALANNGSFGSLKRYFDFIEGTIALDDEYATDVMATSVIESIFFDTVDKAQVKALLGGRSLSVWEEYEDSE
jgi:hypothetical protein